MNTPNGFTKSDAGGYYRHTVLGGYTYRYYVAVWDYLLYDFGFGPIWCRQLMNDYSPSVTVVGGHSYTGLDTFLRSTGPIGC